MARLSDLFTDSALYINSASNGYCVVQLQNALKSVSVALTMPSYNPGAVDGAWGPNLDRALNAWKRLQNLTPNSRFQASDAQVLLRQMRAARIGTATNATRRPEPWHTTTYQIWRTHVASLPQSNPLRAANGLPSASTTTRPATAATTPAGTSAQAAGSDQTYGKLTAANAPLLRMGVCGTQVTLWQRFLRSTSVVPSGSKPRETGEFDAATKAATILVQRWIGANPDGAFGSDSRTKLRARLVAAGYRVTAATPYPAAPCGSSSGGSSSGGTSGGSSSSGGASGGGSAGGGDSMGGAAPSGGPLGGLLNFAGQYGPVMAVGLGVAAFAMLGGGGGSRRR